MYIILSTVLFLAVVVLHEYGHLRAMRNYGIGVKRVCIGLPVRYITLQIEHPRICYGIPVCLSPLLLGAFVEPIDPKEVSGLSLGKQLEICGAGVIINFVMAGVCLATSSQDILIALLWLIFSSAALALKRGISIFVLPLLSLFMSLAIPFVVFGIIKTVPGAGISTSNSVSHICNHLTSFRSAMLLSGFLSLLLGIFNLMPLLPLDGGRMVVACGRRYFSPRIIGFYEKGTLSIMLLIIFVSAYDSALATIRLVVKVIK